MKSLLPLVIFFFLAACTMNPTGSQYHQQSEDRDGTNLATGEEKRKDPDISLYNRFDDPEKTNQNPNFISLREGSANHRADVNKIVQVIETYTDYEPGSIWINGNDVWVTVHAKKERTEEQTKKDREKIYKRLTRAMPRYDIHLNMD